jgi:hypothetical protein
VEQGLLAIRLVRFTLDNNSSPLENLGIEEMKDIKKAWQLTKKLLGEEEIDSFKGVLRHYAD